MSKIEWTGETWNPVVGCSIVSPGCTNCYAMKMAARLQRMAAGPHLDCDGYVVRGTHPLDHYLGTTQPSNAGPVWTGKIALAPDGILLKPLTWKKPRTVFVNSMSDLFHEDVPDEWIDRVFAVMALTPQHTYQVLTKRAARMRDYLSSIWTVAPAPGYPRGDGDKVRDRVAAAAARMVKDGDTTLTVIGRGPWPLPNVWLGVSAERQKEADARIPDLLETPAAVRFVSAEPLLGPIDFTRVYNADRSRPHHAVFDSVLDGMEDHAGTGQCVGWRPPLDWIIVGGESGPGARPMHPDWARSIRDQCAAAGVPFFFKQWGEWAPSCPSHGARVDLKWVGVDGGAYGARHNDHEQDGHAMMARVGKSRAGRLLDGREWSEMPTAAQRTPETEAM